MVFSDVTRRQAFLTHLAVSTFVFVVISWLIAYRWYPDFYFELDGGNRGIVTIFFVDVVLGPGLTLLVFKPGKKSLKFDMTVILLLQLSALVWGIHSVYTERPGSTVFYWGRFTCVNHNDTGGMDMSAIASGPSGLQRLSLLQAPDSLAEMHDFVGKAYLQGSSEIYFYADRIVPLDDRVVARLGKYEISREELADENAASADALESYIDSNTGNNDSYKLIPVVCRYGKAVAVYDLRELRITERLDVATDLRAKSADVSLPGNISVQIKSDTSTD